MDQKTKIFCRFTRIYETQIKKTNNILNKNIDTTFNNTRQKNNYLCGYLGEYATDGR